MYKYIMQYKEYESTVLLKYHNICIINVFAVKECLRRVILVPILFPMDPIIVEDSSHTPDCKTYTFRKSCIK